MKLIKSNELDEAMELLNSSICDSIEESDEFNEYLAQIATQNKPHSYLNSSLLDIKKYKKNPYLSLLSNINIQQGNIHLTKTTAKKFASFLYDEVVYKDSLFEEVNPIGHFNEDFSYPIIYKGKTPWMSIVPHEIETMKMPIEDATGDVLTFGLGLGYFAYMVSQKNDVKSVTIIDTDDNVINIFKKHILPTFPNKNKIKIIKQDCIQFSKNPTQKYDYLFVDTYHTPEDGLPFLDKLNKYVGKVSKKWSFWIMPSMITYFRRYLIMALLDIYYEETDDSEFDQNFEDYLDNMLAKFIRVNKQTTISTVEELQKFLSPNSIEETLYKI